MYERKIPLTSDFFSFRTKKFKKTAIEKISSKLTTQYEHILSNYLALEDDLTGIKNMRSEIKLCQQYIAKYNAEGKTQAVEHYISALKIAKAKLNQINNHFKNNNKDFLTNLTKFEINTAKFENQFIIANNIVKSDKCSSEIEFNINYAKGVESDIKNWFDFIKIKKHTAMDLINEYNFQMEDLQK